MRIAVTYESGQVFQRFGHSEQIKLYDFEDGILFVSPNVHRKGIGYAAWRAVEKLRPEVKIF